MFKLSFAAALLIGAKAVATDAKTEVVAKTEDIHDASIDFLSAL